MESNDSPTFQTEKWGADGGLNIRHHRPPFGKREEENDRDKRRKKETTKRNKRQRRKQKTNKQTNKQKDHDSIKVVTFKRVPKPVSVTFRLCAFQNN